MAWFDFVNSAGIIGALVTGAYQTRRLASEARERDADRRTERSLELYRDLVVEGDTAKAFHRLSVLLRHEGTKRFGATTWYILQESDFGSGGLLDPSEIGLDTPFQDLYRVLWFFERAHIALNYGLTDPDVFFHTAGFHCWWWDQLCHDITSPKASAALRRLAPMAVGWAMKNAEYENWVAHCKTDFDGHGPYEERVETPLYPPRDPLANSDSSTHTNATPPLGNTQPS